MPTCGPRSFRRTTSSSGRDGSDHAHTSPMPRPHRVRGIVLRSSATRPRPPAPRPLPRRARQLLRIAKQFARIRSSIRSSIMPTSAQCCRFCHMMSLMEYLSCRLINISRSVSPPRRLYEIPCTERATGLERVGFAGHEQLPSPCSAQAALPRPGSVQGGPLHPRPAGSRQARRCVPPATGPCVRGRDARCPDG